MWRGLGWMLLWMLWATLNNPSNPAAVFAQDWLITYGKGSH